MEGFRKTVWSEGMLLTPHHLQNSDLYHERLIGERILQLCPFAWGITHLLVDTDALRNGNFSLISVKAVMPDGLILNLPEHDPLPQSRPFDKFFAPSSESLDVYLGIPLESPGGPNCQTEGNITSRPVRYTAEYANFADYNTGDNVREVAVAKKNVHVFFAGEELSSYVTFQMGQVVRVSHGSFALRDIYIPPLMHLAASSFLLRLIQGLLEVIYTKRGSLVALHANPEELSTVNLKKFFLLQILNAYIPMLSHFAVTGKVHPERLYVLLVQLAGELSTVSAEIDPKELPPYMHTNLTHTFTDLELRIRSAIESLTATNYISIVLSSSRDNVWVGQITDENLLKTGEFYLVVNGDVPEEQLRELLPKRLKVGGAEELELIVSRALPGVRLTYVVRPPSSLPIRPRHTYFRLETQGEFWESVRRSRTVALNVPSVLKGLKLELLATKG